MGYFLSNEQMNDVLRSLREDQNIKVCAPKKVTRRGRGKKKDEIRYGELRDLSELVYDQKSDYGPKEMVYPISQTLLYFRGTEVEVKELDDDRNMIIFARPCDINAMKRLDNIFLNNGGKAEYYYARLRTRAKFIMIECTESFETCFCVSMGANRTEDYAAAVRFTEEGVYVDVKDPELEFLFDAGEQTDFTPEYVAENLRTVQVPDIPDRSYLADIIGLDYWKQFDERCILCGGCNTTCPTCSCFDTNDITYDETSLEGERRRTWSSCMLSSYTVMAGGHGVRESAAANTRFKTLHKIYDYRLRFGGEDNMCVGCGRCDMKCPQEIKFSETIGGLAEEVEKLKEARNAAEKGGEA